MDKESDREVSEVDEESEREVSEEIRWGGACGQDRTMPFQFQEGLMEV